MPVVLSHGRPQQPNAQPVPGRPRKRTVVARSGSTMCLDAGESADIRCIVGEPSVTNTYLPDAISVFKSIIEALEAQNGC